MKWTQRKEQAAIAAIGTVTILAIIAIMCTGCIRVQAPDGRVTTRVDTDAWIAITSNSLEHAEAAVRRWQAYERARLQGATDLMYDVVAIAEGLSEALARRDALKAQYGKYMALKAAEAPDIVIGGGDIDAPASSHILE